MVHGGVGGPERESEGNLKRQAIPICNAVNIGHAYCVCVRVSV